MSNTLIRLNNVHFSRGDRKIFNGLQLNVQKGKITAIMGPSGIGKTTLLKLIGGQIQPESGEIWFEDSNIVTLKRADLYKVREKMGMLFQSGALFTDMSVFDNVAFPLREHTELDETLIRSIVLLKLEAVGLRGASELMPSELSGGMARRVALARAIALDPELIMYDEPFVGQDPITMGILVELIKKFNQALGLTSVVVSHDVDEVMEIADYVYILSDGRVIAEGSPDQLRKTDDQDIQRFLQGKTDGEGFVYPAQPLQEELFNG